MKVKRYEEGGELDAKFTELGGAMDIAQGAVKSIYGIKQLSDANQALSAAKAAQPSLETPAQFYENYRNAYDSELARIETDAIQGNLATSVQALQGAGGRALVGGLGAATAQAQSAQNRMLAQERQARMLAGQQLALAEDKSLVRREARNQREMAQAQQAANAARQNIVGGVTNVATGLLAGGAKPIIAGAKKAAGAVGKAGKAIGGIPSKIDDYFTQRGIEKTRKAIGGFEMNDNMQNFINNQSSIIREAGQSWQDYYGKINFDKAVKSTMRPVNILEENVDRVAMQQAQFIQDQTAKAVAPSDQTSQYSGVGGAMTFDGTGYGIIGGVASTVGNVLGGAGGSFEGGSQMIDYNLQQIQNSPMYGKEGFVDPATGKFIKNPNPEGGYDFGITPVSDYEQGGMMTKGSFNHNSNPIDLIQNGQKIGEATGGEYILNPKQAAAIKKESSYARKLFKQFEKKAKTKK